MGKQVVAGSKWGLIAQLVRAHCLDKQWGREFESLSLHESNEEWSPWQER